MEYRDFKPILNNFNCVSWIMTYYGAYRNSKYFMKRFTNTTLKMWNQKHDQFLNIFDQVNQDQYKYLKVNIITESTLDKLIKYSKQGNKVKLSCTITTIVDYELIIKFISQIKTKRLPISFNWIEFKNIMKHAEEYQFALELLFRLGVPKQAIKGTLYSLGRSSRSRLIREKLDYVDTIIGKNSLRMVKQCDTLYYDKSVASCLALSSWCRQVSCVKAPMNKLSIQDQIEAFTQILDAFPTLKSINSEHHDTCHPEILSCWNKSDLILDMNTKAKNTHSDPLAEISFGKTFACLVDLSQGTFKSKSLYHF